MKAFINKVKNNQDLKYELIIILSVLAIGFWTVFIHWSMVDDGKSAQIAVQLTTAVKTFNPNLFFESLLERDTGRFRPGYWLYLWITFVIAGDNDTYHHIIHLMLFISSAILLFKTCSKVFKNKNVGLVTSLLFIFDSMTIENWYRLGPQEPILTFFILLALNYFIKYRELGDRKNLVFSIIFVIISGLVKESAIAFLGVPIIIFLADLFFVHDKSLIKRNLLFILLSSTILIGIRLFAFWAYPLIGYASLYKIDSALMVNLGSYIKNIHYAYGPFIELLIVIFVLRFTISVIKTNFSVTVSRFYWKIIFLSWFLIFFAIQLPWTYAFTRYLQLSLLGLFAFMGSELVDLYNNLTKINDLNSLKFKRLDIEWLTWGTKYTSMFVLVFILIYHFLVGINYIIWVTNISNFDDRLINSLDVYAKDGRRIFFNADRAQDEILETYYEVQWHLEYIYKRKLNNFAYLTSDYEPKKGDIVFSHTERVFRKPSDLEKYGLVKVDEFQSEFSNLTLTTPYQMLKSIPRHVLAITKSQNIENNMYAIAKFSYNWQIYEKQ